jgi:hypothetical protein
MSSATTFKGFNNIGDSSPTELIKTSLVYWLNHGFVDKGAYFNVNIPTSGEYGGSEHQLRPVQEPGMTDGRVWESFRSDWVWESGLSQPTQPIRVSGAFVGNTFHVAGDDHYVDYVNGQIVFDTAIATTSVVTAEYSFRWIHAYDGSEIPWFRETQFSSQRIDTDTFLNGGSGDLSTLSRTRMQLPAVVMELVDATMSPRQLGLGQWLHQDVIFHVIAEDGNTADKIADYLSQQNDKTIYLFNSDLVADSGTFPLDYRGSVASGAKTYPQLVEAVEDGGFRWRKLRFSDVRKQRTNVVNQNLHIKPVRFTTEVALTSN